MPPGGFRLALVNCWDLQAGLAVRERLKRLFRVVSLDGKWSAARALLAVGPRAGLQLWGIRGALSDRDVAREMARARKARSYLPSGGSFP